MDRQQDESEYSGSPDEVVWALRKAMAALGACAVAFEKIEQGTEQTPVHVRKDDARRAYAEVRAVLEAHDVRTRVRRNIDRFNVPEGIRE